MPDKTYTIKPLEWGSGPMVDGYETHYVNTIFSTLYVRQETEGGQTRFSWDYCRDEFYDEGGGACDSIADGKAKAEAWYFAQLLPALVEST